MLKITGKYRRDMPKNDIFLHLSKKNYSSLNNYYSFYYIIKMMFCDFFCKKSSIVYKKSSNFASIKFVL